MRLISLIVSLRCLVVALNSQGELAPRAERSSISQVLPLRSRRNWSLTGRSLQDWRLSDIAMIATLDGSLYALERATGDIRWTISSADAAIRSKQGTDFNTSNPALPNTEKETWIVEPIDDGCLYTFNTKEGLKKLPFGIKQLVENSPFTVPGDDKVYVGERKTTLYSVDPKTGNVLQAYGTEFGHTSATAPKCPMRDSLDELDEDDECTLADPNASDILKIGRNTYTLTIFAGAETLWNITYTEWVPNSIDVDLQRQYEATFDGQYISPLHDGRVLAHQSETNDAVWLKQLSAPAVRVYDVLHQYDTYAPEVTAVAVVAQPLDPHFSQLGHENYVDGDRSTYIGQTIEGDWFALSAAKCPLVGNAPVSKWSEGLSLGTTDDLLGVHTHQKAPAEQPKSPGHRLTLDGPETDYKTIGPGAPRSNKVWMIYSVLATLLAIALGFGKLPKSSMPAMVSQPQVQFAEEVRVIEPVEPVPVVAEPLPVPTPVSSPEPAQEPETPKTKRKRGSRGGKKNRENAAKAENEEPEVIQTILAKPIATESLFPLKINELLVTDKILGYGSHGTIVYQGSFEGRDVAVKRMLLDFFDIASHEVVLLQESDDHPNVIRYYCKQQNERFLYIALELCAASLADVTEHPNDHLPLVEAMNDLVSVLRQMALGVQYLHALKIVHRDLKPQNILVNPPRKSVVPNTRQECARLVISDFGLCKKLDADQSSFRATTAQAAGTSGWRAPELLCDDAPTPAISDSTSGSGVLNGPGTPRKVSRAIDIFSLGCVFYYVLSNGAHPFGDRYMREGNIIKGRCSLDHLDILGDLGVLAKDLIGQMIQANPKDRPDATTVLQHPFFWTAERRLNFLLDVSDRFEIEERDPPSPLLLLLESEAEQIVQNNWYSKLDRHLIDNLGKYRKYNGASILDLLRALRNKKHHYQDLPEPVQVALGPIPHGFLRYFTIRFPKLLLYSYYLTKRELWQDPAFSTYF